MPHFRKKPVVIEAVQWTGKNFEEVRAFYPSAITHVNLGTVSVRTLEGTMNAAKGDWIIKGVKGEFYPCKPDIFEATYEQLSGGGGGNG